MKLKTQKSAHVCNITVEGELVLRNAADFRKKMLSALESGKPINIDLNAVNDIDTSCYQVLVQLKQECTVNGKEFTISSMSEPFKEIVAIYGMQQYFG